jgi:alkylation response protein AidB-like acyl-CoA dehydrogenase
LVITWHQRPEELDASIRLVEPVRRLVGERGLSGYADEERSQEHEFPEENIRLLAAEGLLGMRIPVRYGGLELDSLNTTYVLEQIARVAPATAFVLLLHTLTANRINVGGTDEHRERYLTKIGSGALGASAWSESGVGADKAVLNTKAFRENDIWHLNGQKAFCTGAGHAGVYMVMTDTTEGKAFFLVDSDNPGLRIGQPMDSMGLQGTHSGALSLENAVVPDADRVGEPGKIGPIIDIDMQSGLHSGIIATGIALGAFERLLDIVKLNGSFEKFESVRVRVSQLAATLSVMRTHMYALATMASKPVDQRPPIEAATMTAKLFLSESALQMTTDAIAIAGKAGYLRENGLERLHRDALGIVIAAPINGQILGSIGESLRRADRTSHLYKV